MNLNLDKCLCVFDVETTGLDISKDRIVEISILKVDKDGSQTTFTSRINPEMKISEESISIHGITNEDIENAPTFREISSKIESFIGDADLAGYNSNKFDIPLLAEEFLRVGSNFKINERKFVDVQNIFHKMEQRTLVAAYKFYCDKDLNDAHSAEADVKATFEVLLAQLERYNELENNIDFLSEFSVISKNKMLDFAGRIAVNENGEAIYNFGKHKGKTIKEVDKHESGYYGWMMSSNFPLFTKSVLKQEIEKIRRDSKKEVAKKSREVRIEDKLEQLKNKFNNK